MINEQKKMVLKICIILAVIFVIGALIVFSNVLNGPKVSRVTYTFEWNGNPYLITIKFDSPGGTFTSGETIHTQSILGYPVNSTTKESFYLYFPNSLTPDDYQKLVTLQDNFVYNQTTGSIGYSFPASRINVFHGYPPSTKFDVVWTQEGMQDGYLQILSPNGNNSSIYLKYSNETGVSMFQFFNNTGKSKIIPLKNMINIQPSEVRLQLASSNNSLGFGLVVIALTVITIGIGVNQLPPLERNTSKVEEQEHSTKKRNKN